MPIYRNLNGNSSVTFYEIDTLNRKIYVQFNSGITYTYSEKNIGLNNYNLMIEHANRGYGLGGLIRKNPIIREGYDEKRGQ